MDDIWFRAPVEIGAMLYFNSQICYVQVRAFLLTILKNCHCFIVELNLALEYCYLAGLLHSLQDNYIQTRVSAEVVDPQTGEMSITNVFHFTFLAKEKTPPSVVPKTYHEVAKYMKTIGPRTFLLAGHDVPDRQTPLQSLHKPMKILTVFKK